MNSVSDLSPAQAWAYALGAPYHLAHQVPLNALPERNDSTIKAMEEILRSPNAWSINGPGDLVRTLDWLGTEGHRRPHGLTVRRYTLLPRPAIAARREELRETGQEDNDALEELWRLDAVQADTDGIRGGVLIGFDAARAVMLARSGWVVGWLSDAALWNYLLDMARDVQRQLGSWAEYGADFRRSRNFWLADNSPSAFDTVIQRLLKQADSPWRTLPWRVPGLDVPRAVRPFDAEAPMWMLDRWDQ